MATSDQQPNTENLSQAPVPNDALDEDHDASAEVDDDAMPAASEVARRINLLGKLIIPPSAP